MINQLDLVKEHIRVTSDDEDALIRLYMAAAADWIANYLDDQNFVATPSIQAAHLLLVEGLYENRGAQTAGVEIKENPAVRSLLFPYRKNLGV